MTSRFLLQPPQCLAAARQQHTCFMRREELREEALSSCNPAGSCMRASIAQGQHACWCVTARTENHVLEFFPFSNTEDCVWSRRGFPPAVTQLKRVLDRMHADAAQREPRAASGPKTSLGALRDDKRLTPQQLQHPAAHLPRGGRPPAVLAPCTRLK